MGSALSLVDIAGIDRERKVKFNGLSYYPAYKTVMDEKGDFIPLDPNQYSLLDELAQNPGWTVNFSALENRAWGHVGREYRRNLGFEMAGMNHLLRNSIVLVRDVGYFLNISTPYGKNSNYLPPITNLI